MSILGNSIGIPFKRKKGRGGGSTDIVYPGLIAAWSAKGKTNEDEDRAVLRDLTGNGHDMALVNFAFNVQGSGYMNPEYPDSLMFDGVDDYGYCDNMPILTDYTLIVKRTHMGGNTCIVSKSAVVGEGAFIFEGDGPVQTYSFGTMTNIDRIKGSLSWQTSYSYNDQKINKGNSPDSNSLYLGVLRKDDPAKRYFRGLSILPICSTGYCRNMRLFRP